MLDTALRAKVLAKINRYWDFQPFIGVEDNQQTSWEDFGIPLFHTGRNKDLVICGTRISLRPNLFCIFFEHFFVSLIVLMRVSGAVGVDYLGWKISPEGKPPPLLYSHHCPSLPPSYKYNRHNSVVHYSRLLFLTDPGQYSEPSGLLQGCDLDNETLTTVGKLYFHPPKPYLNYIHINNIWETNTKVSIVSKRRPNKLTLYKNTFSCLIQKILATVLECLKVQYPGGWNCYQIDIWE